MIPVQQTKFSSHDGTQHGNCLRACIASILEVDIDDIPAIEDMGEGYDWFKPLWDYLVSHGYTYEGTLYAKRVEDFAAYRTGVDGYYIVGGASPRGFIRGHAVVYKDGVMVHDPHPDGTGLLDMQEIYMIERDINGDSNSQSMSYSLEH